MKIARTSVAAVLLVAALVAGAAGMASAANTTSVAGAPAAQLLVGDSLVVCNKVAVAFVLDGRLEKWDGYPSLNLSAATAQYVGGVPWGPADISAQLRCAWDSQNLYVSADVSDDILISDSSTTWDDDSLELAIDGDSDRACCSARDRQITVSLDGRLADFGIVQSASNVSRVVLPRTGGYVVEMAIPFSSFLGSTPYQGALVGFTYGLSDDDDGGRRDSHLLWMGADITGGFDLFGALVLLGPLSGSPTATQPAATATLPPTATATPRPPLATPTTAAPTATRTPVPATATRTSVPATATPTPAAGTATRTTVPATATRTLVPATATRTSVPAVTATPAATPGAAERIEELESSVPRVRSLLERILALLQTAAYLPDNPPTPGPTRTPTATRTPVFLGYEQRVNAGGTAFTDSRGKTWAADQAYSAGSWGYVGGMTASTTVPISGTVDDALYQSERYNLASYQIDLANGDYEVELRFAEIYQYAGLGQRVFSVQIEGTPVITDVDIFAVAGPNTAYDSISAVTVADGQLNIDFAASKGAAKISALRVTARAPAGPTPTPSLADRTTNLESSFSELEDLLDEILAAFQDFLGISP